jgi:hypothetical protein
MSPVVRGRMFSYPPSLHPHIAHARRFAEMLAALEEHADPRDPGFVWLSGRAAEVRVFVADVVREWARGRMDDERAADLVELYVDDLHAELAKVTPERAGEAPACCTSAPAIGRRSA